MKLGVAISILLITVSAGCSGSDKVATNSAAPAPVAADSNTSTAPPTSNSPESHEGPPIGTPPAQQSPPVIPPESHPGSPISVPPAVAAALVVVTFEAGDSKRFYDALSGLGNIQTVIDPTDDKKRIATAKFVSRNQAVTVRCDRHFDSGFEMESACQVAFDASKSDPNETEIRTGAVGGVQVARIHNVFDVQSLFEKVLRSGPFIQTIETVLVTRPDGTKAKNAKVRMECLKTVSEIDRVDLCRILAYPE